MPVTGYVKRKRMIPVIGSKPIGREVIADVGSKRKDQVPVTGYLNRKRMIPVIGWKLIGRLVVPVIWF